MEAQVLDPETCSHAAETLGNGVWPVRLTATRTGREQERTLTQRLSTGQRCLSAPCAMCPQHIHCFVIERKHAYAMCFRVGDRSVVVDTVSDLQRCLFEVAILPTHG